MQLTPLLLWLSLNANAAEVVWLAPPSDADRDRVAEQAGATGPVLAPIDLRAAATRWSKADQEAYDNLDATLAEVRAYETKLDGELLIMRDLTAPLDALTLVRDDADRNKIYGALAYQGFAVNRFFDAALATDEQAAPYRYDLEGVFVERPWMDAVALDPEREVTPYDIAEAPQRVAYGRVAATVKRALPASLTPVGLPEGATLVVDGRKRPVGPSGNIKLPPGRHRAHVVLEDHVIARWDLRLEPGEAKEMGPELTVDDFSGFLSNLTAESAVPAALGPHLAALGGEVWIASPGDRDPVVFAVTPSGVTEVKLDKPPSSSSAGETSMVSVLVSAQGGWFYSADFLLQEPVAKNVNSRQVNAASLSGLAAVDFNLSGFQFGAGLQLWLPLGDDHVAVTGTKDMRPRPYPHVAVGFRYVQLTGGYLFPYHPGVGGRVMIPIAKPVEVLVSGLYGIKGRLANGDGTFYKSGDVRTINAGLGLRF